MSVRAAIAPAIPPMMGPLLDDRLPVDAAAAAEDVVVAVEVAVDDFVLSEATGADLSTEDTDVVEEEVCELAV